MVYTIKFYDEKYLQRQFEIGNSVLSNWLGAQQSRIDVLQKAYSKPGFDPETKLYAFSEDRIVGFITSGIRDTDDVGNKFAFMEFPIVEKDHARAENELMMFAFDLFKSKGVTHIISRASSKWGETIKKADQYGYQFSKDLWVSARLNIKNLKIEVDFSNIEIINPDMDLSEIKNILVDFRGMKSEEVDNYFIQLKEIRERIVSWVVIKDENEIVAHEILVQDKYDPKKSRMNAIYSVGSNKKSNRDLIMHHHIMAAQKKGIEFIDSFFWNRTFEYHTDYEKYGFELATVSDYEKEL